MTESEWDIVLENERGITLGSGSTAEVIARVYSRNRPVPQHEVRLSTQSQNRRSPIVAFFDEYTKHTDAEGRIKATVKAIDLINPNKVYNPVDLVQYDNIPLPMDRYYGNYI